jgi:hypothetical protein
MSLDNLFINNATQDLYAEIVAIEDISEGNETDSELLKSNNINIGEITHELY